MRGQQYAKPYAHLITHTKTLVNGTAAIPTKLLLHGKVVDVQAHPSNQSLISSIQFMDKRHIFNNKFDTDSYLVANTADTTTNTNKMEGTTIVYYTCGFM